MDDIIFNDSPIDKIVCDGDAIVYDHDTVKDKNKLLKKNVSKSALGLKSHIVSRLFEDRLEKRKKGIWR